MKKAACIFLVLILSLHGCSCQNSGPKDTIATVEIEQAQQINIPFDTSARTIHVYVALCDNQYQGIVPVPEKIGNGQDPKNNLYWGCGYGVKTYFTRSKEWKLIQEQKPDSLILERLVFKSTTGNYYLIAEAYNGKFIKDCIENFLRSSCGKLRDTLTADQKVLGKAGNAELIVYVGHDGLMEFSLNESFLNTDKKKREVIILSCASRDVFSPYLKKANVTPLLWSTGLMSPEAYTLHDALTGYVRNEPAESQRKRAAQAYSKFTKCSEKAAMNLLVSGW